MLVFIDDATGRLVAPVYSWLTEGVATPDLKGSMGNRDYTLCLHSVDTKGPDVALTGGAARSKAFPL